MSRNQRAQILADDWVQWLKTRSFYGQPQQKHILAILSMPDTSGEPPNARNNPEMQAFNASVTSLTGDLGRAFIRIYCDEPKMPIKTLAFDEGITPAAYYNRAHKAAEEILRGMTLIKCYDLLRVNSRNNTNYHDTQSRKYG